MQFRWAYEICPHLLKKRLLAKLSDKIMLLKI
jgi:hypothetical protein